MNGSEETPSVSRRAVVRGAAGLGLASPFALAAPARAQSTPASGSGAHPAVGVWIEPSVSDPTSAFNYHVLHADGTHACYDATLAAAFRQGDPKLPTFGFGVWEARGERGVELSWRIAWGDAGVASQMTFKGWWSVDETGGRMSGGVKLRLIDGAGKVITQQAGSTFMERLRLEPFATPATPEATPGT